MTDVEFATRAVMAATSVYNLLLNVHAVHNQQPQKRRRRSWIRKIHSNRTKESMTNMFEELQHIPSGEFENFCRMSPSDFEFLLDQIGPVIAKRDTEWRDAIPTKIRLAVTLRFLATGDSYQSLHYLFKISPQIISKIVPEVCAALYDALRDEIKMPSNADDWLAIERGFGRNFPHCIGALDGKHIVVQCLAHSGSEFYNYKKTFSIVLVALVDSNYRFIFADVGSQGRISDGGVFRNNALWQKISFNTANIPAARPLPGSTIHLPYVLIADGAFAPSEYIMKPYPGHHATTSQKRIFNQRLSSSRVVVENVFGILTSVFGVFKRALLLNPDTVAQLTMTCILLHNFLRRSGSSRKLYTPPGTTDCVEDGVIVWPGSWRLNPPSSGAIHAMDPVARRPTLSAMHIRDEFAKYFATDSVHGHNPLD